MATLVLTVVGSVVGGPIGAAIGAVVGQQIDSRLFAPKGRKGPRLGDLAAQSSTYGSPIPRLYGRSRVAGTVIWATDLVEDRRKVSTGKGRPKQTTYTYSANFAVALSARRISRVGRIWADGKLLRGDGGDFKTQTMFRLYDGSEDQSVDPFIASAEGIGAAPAYRGTAYALFEDFQLADYGNRIPALSFEVIADEAPVSIGTILSDLDAGISATAPTLLDGLAVTGESARGIAGGLMEGVTLYARDDGAVLQISETAPAGPAVTRQDFGATADGKSVPLLQQDRRPWSALPRRRTLSYYDVDRDYQLGSQSVLRPDLGPREVRSELAASLTSTAARVLIERKTAEAGAGRDEISLSLPWRYLTLGPAERIIIPGIAGHWLVREMRLEGMVVRLSLTRLPSSAPIPIVATDPGRGLFEPDLLHGPTALALLDLPWLGTGVATSPAVYAVAAGTQPGWRRAGLLQSNDGGLTYDDIGATAAPAIMGAAITSLGPTAGQGFDTHNGVEVDLLHSAMILSPSTPDSLIAGRNLALLGDELIQFERADPLSATRYRLSGLLRGRRGTEAAMAAHSIGERFILIETEAMLPLVVPIEAATISIQAQGLGDTLSVQRQVDVKQNALIPLSPVHLTATRWPSGDTEIRWARRSRDGWHWVDHVDAPLGEDGERYRITLTTGGGAARSEEVSNPSFIYSAAARTADYTAGALIMAIEVRQLGSFGPSPAATLTLPLS